MNFENLKNPLNLISRPFDGFWELKYELKTKPNVILSIIIVFSLVVTNILSSQYSGFIVNIYNPDEMNSILEVVYVVIPLLYWCIANWSLTTLMDGEGKFVQIFMATCFALVPLVIINFPLIWISNILTSQEVMFYYLAQTFGLLWFVFLIFVGIMTVHQYTPAKTVLTILLTFVAMGFMAFLTMLFFSLIQQIIAFITVIYQEISFRYL